MKTAIHIALLTVALLWGLVFVAVARLLPSMDAFQLVTIRFVLISVAFLAMFAFVPSTRPQLTRHDLGILLVLGLLGVPGSQLPVVQAQNYLSPALASIMITTSPAWVALFASVWLRERFRPVQILGFVVAMMGAIIVIIAGSGKGDIVVDNPWGAALALITPLAWAGFTILSKQLSGRFEPITLLGLGLIAGTIVMAPLYPHTASSVLDLSGSQWAWMLYLVVGGTLLPYFIWFSALRVLDASRTAAYMYLVPFAALGWSWLILDIVPDAAALLGGLILIVGVVMTQRARTVEVAIPPKELVIT